MICRVCGHDNKANASHFRECAAALSSARDEILGIADTPAVNPPRPPPDSQHLRKTPGEVPTRNPTAVTPDKKLKPVPGGKESLLPQHPANVD